ncbi:MAG: cation:proton antiporter [Actinobacteria bacterium]|nr:cation:proton antiporter [Actinomycetota bacterium]
MADTHTFAQIVLAAAVVGLAAVLSNRLTERLHVPAPAVLLVVSAVAVKVIPDLHAPPTRTVERLVTVALLCILFDGGIRIGVTRFRAAAMPIALVGVLGTFLTVAAAGALAHWAFDLSWYAALLVATAVSPTDPAVVFSVLGNRQISGRSGTILEGESGANDPVGIALMASLLSAHGLSDHAFGHIAAEFAIEMAVGAAIGLVGGIALLGFIRSVPLPTEGLYPIRTLACVLLLYGATALAHGSGFLAVFAAGIVIGDERAPFKREIERFHGALASLAEIVAFVALGLTVDVGQLGHLDTWLPGITLAAALALVIRPALVGLCLIPARLAANELTFVLFAGFKGAVPILLGSSLLTEQAAHTRRLYGIVVVVVIFSVVVQGGLTSSAARWLRIPMTIVEPEPWALGIRLRSEPDTAHRFTVAAGSSADGQRVDELSQLPGHASISMVVRDGHLLTMRGSTTLLAGDVVLVLADPAARDDLIATFGDG